MRTCVPVPRMDCLSPVILVDAKSLLSRNRALHLVGGATARRVAVLVAKLIVVEGRVQLAVVVDRTWVPGVLPRAVATEVACVANNLLLVRLAAVHDAAL